MVVAKNWTVVWVVLAVLIGVGIASIGGCQMDVSGSVSTKVLYPDEAFGKKVGDPRQKMYAGSGYKEDFGSYNKSDRSFQKPVMGGEK